MPTVYPALSQERHRAGSVVLGEAKVVKAVPMSGVYSLGFSAHTEDGEEAY